MVLITDYNTKIAEVESEISDLNLNTDELRYYPFVVSLDRRDRNYKTLYDLSPMILDLLCVPNKTENINLKVLNMVSKNTNHKHS